MKAETLERLLELAHRIQHEDNAATNLPLFAVQQRVRTWGLDPDYSDRIAWINVYDDHRVAEGEEHARLEAGYGETGGEPDGWTRTAYTDRFEFVTACLTREGCEAFLKVNGHNLTDPRVYVYSGWRNAEWSFLREAVLELAEELRSDRVRGILTNELEHAERVNARLGAVVGENYYPGVECEHGFDFCPACDRRGTDAEA